MTAPLSRELAQRMVDEVSPTLEHNVNVMDRTGIIIASSDPSRVGSFHGGAQEAAATGRPVVVRVGGAQEGARPGVNLPLGVNGEIVGVVGLTGPPEEVTGVAQVLVLTMQLLLTRERELDASARREARDLDLLSRLVNGRLAHDAVASALASQPGIRVPWRLSAIVSPESAGSSTARLPDDVHGVTQRMQALGRFRLASFRGALWVLGRADAGDDAVLSELAGGALVLRGDACADAATLEGSAKTLAALVARPCFIPATVGVLPTADLTAELAVACMPDDTVGHLASRVTPLSAAQRGTVEAYLDAGHSVSGAARALFTHRNTVIQRLDRVAELIGLDPRMPRHAVTLRLALIASRRTGHNDHAIALTGPEL